AARVVGCDALQAEVNGLAQALARARLLAPQVGFEFGEGLFDGVEIGAVGRQERQAAAAGFDALAHRGGLVHIELVHHDDLAWARQAARSASSRSLALTLIFFVTPVKDAPQEPRQGRGANLDAVLLTQPLAAFL